MCWCRASTAMSPTSFISHKLAKAEAHARPGARRRSVPRRKPRPLPALAPAARRRRSATPHGNCRSARRRGLAILPGGRQGRLRLMVPVTTGRPGFRPPEPSPPSPRPGITPRLNRADHRRAVHPISIATATRSPRPRHTRDRPRRADRHHRRATVPRAEDACLISWTRALSELRVFSGGQY
jgi:hypothetical protein